MSKGPQLRELKLTTQETDQLLEWTRRHKTSQALALVRASSWRARKGRTTSRWPRPAVSFGRRWASGAAAFLSAGSTACSISRGPVRRASSMTRESSS